jgi:type IV pilus assembly protein PilV
MKYQKGITLIEVMISILIVALGLLGMAGLATSAIKYSKMASFQSTASRMVEDYSERMRANVSGVGVDFYSQAKKYTGRSVPAAIPSCSIPGDCTSQEIAAIDLAEWNNELIRSLPAGGAWVQQSNDNNFAYDIWIFWIDPDINFGDGELNLRAGCPEEMLDLGDGDVIPNCIYQKVVI